MPSSGSGTTRCSAAISAICRRRSRCSTRRSARTSRRFASEPDPRTIIEASRAAGVHEMIVRLPDGYNTQLGPQGMALSAGQRQRIGLARALYGNPFLVILDEPNSNLDGEGETALTAAIAGIRDRGGIAIVVAHRPSALAAIDLVAVVQGGRLAGFGPKDEIISSLSSAPGAAHAPAFPRRTR